MTAPVGTSDASNPANPPTNTSTQGELSSNVDFMPSVPGLPGLGTTAGLPTLPRANDPQVF